MNVGLKFALVVLIVVSLITLDLDLRLLHDLSRWLRCTKKEGITALVMTLDRFIAMLGSGFPIRVRDM